MSPWPLVNVAPFSILSMGTFFAKHQSCLKQIQKYFYRAIQQRVFSRFSPDIIEIELLRYINSDAHTVGGTSTCFGQFSYLCPKEPEGVRRSSDLYCPIRENYEVTQKNETECFQVLNMASLARRNLQAINLLPDMLW